MHICFVNLDYAPARSSGLGVYGETLVQGLIARGHEVTVVARQVTDAPTSKVLGGDGVQVLRVPGGRLDWISFARRAAPAVAELARTRHFDLIHYADVHFAYPYRGPYIATLHQSFRQRLQARGNLPAYSGGLNLLSRLSYYTTARQLAERPALARARHLIAVSRTTARAYADEYDLGPERISVVRNGIDTAHFTSTPSDLREQLGLTRAQVLLFVGFCTARKGLEYLAAAMRQLPPDVHLLVIGRWDERYRRRVMAALGEAAPRMLALGYVSDQELPAYYTMADLFVLPSLLEGFGLPIAEALACGTPVVATAAGACPEVVGPGGLVVPAMDADALALAIGSLLQQPERRQELARLGRAWARSSLSAEQMVAGHIEAYERVLGGKEGSLRARTTR